MIRYYKFADVQFSLEGLPENIPDGKYLGMFRIDPAAPNLTIKIQLQELELTEDAIHEGNRYFVEKQGKRYLYSWFRTPHPAVISAPEDWAKQDVPIVINPELCKDCLFTVNQLLSLSGFYSGLLHRGCGVLHSSYVAVGDRAILFAGFSGQGKSTQAELWRQYRGAEIINGDRALIFRRKGSWYAGGLSVCGSSQICVNRTVKSAALILLEKSKKNVVCPVAAAEGYSAVMTGIAFHRWSSSEMLLADRLVMDIISEVPMYRLYNRADEESVEVLEKEIGGTLYDI